MAAALERKARIKPPKLTYDGGFDARRTALACSDAPAGRVRWTVQLLAEKVVELNIAVSLMTVQRSLKKRVAASSDQIPPDGNAAFVAGMEEVLAVYQLPRDALFPVVCMGESSKQIVGEVQAPMAAAPGHGQILDHE